jgi:hypothetical protein
MKKLISTILLILLSGGAFSQWTQFQLGFKQGFINGYCMDTVGCISPIPPYPPLPNVTQSASSYQDGYNTGLLAGNAAHEYVNMKKGTTNITPSYNPPPPINNSGYNPSIDLNKLEIVLKYKQQLFDANADWIQNRINYLNFQNQMINSGNNMPLFTKCKNSLDEFISILNSNKVDFSDQNIFNGLANHLFKIQQLIYSKY